MYSDNNIGFCACRFYNIDISIAVSTDGGLITPIVFNADKMVSRLFAINSFVL